MNKIKSTTIQQLVEKVIDNRGRNPGRYANGGYYVLDNYLINNTRYPSEKEVRRFIDQETHDIFLRKYLKKNDVCVTLVGNGIGSTCMVPSEEWVTIQNTIGLRANSSTDSAFLYYFLKLIKPSVINLDRGSSQPSILQGDLLRLKVKVIDDYEQQVNIGAVLSALDDKIELNRRINTELEQMVRTLYDYWFVQFDFPGPDGKPYKSSGGKMTYNDQLKREIPTGWKVCELQERCTSYLGGTPSRKNINYWNSNDIAWLSSGEVANFPIIDSEEKISKDGLRNSAAQLLDKGSVMISITGNIHVSILGIDASANQSVVGITPTEEVSSEYLYLYISRLVPKLEAMMTGAVQKHINKKVVDEIQLLVPEQSILREFDSIVKPMYEKILVNSQQSQKLAELRDWLLPMLMNGQIRVE